MPRSPLLRALAVLPVSCWCPVCVMQRNAEALALGVRAICYELNASKDEVRLTG
jgi:hypothetical protein